MHLSPCCRVNPFDLPFPCHYSLPFHSALPSVSNKKIQPPFMLPQVAEETGEGHGWQISKVREKGGKKEVCIFPLSQADWLSKVKLSVREKMVFQTKLPPSQDWDRQKALFGSVSTHPPRSSKPATRKRVGWRYLLGYKGSFPLYFCLGLDEL